MRGKIKHFGPASSDHPTYSIKLAEESELSDEGLRVSEGLLYACLVHLQLSLGLGLRRLSPQPQNPAGSLTLPLQAP